MPAKYALRTNGLAYAWANTVDELVALGDTLPKDVSLQIQTHNKVIGTTFLDVWERRLWKFTL